MFPKVGEGSSCTFTQPLRGWVTLRRWQPEVHFLPVSVCVTYASGSTCTALTRWEHWRWFNRSHISINNSKSFTFLHVRPRASIHVFFFFIVICCQMIHHSQHESLICFIRNFCPVVLRLSLHFSPFTVNHLIPTGRNESLPAGKRSIKARHLTIWIIISIFSCLF